MFKPATKLPWEWLPDEGQFIVNAKRDIVAEVPCQGCEAQDGAYLVHAANAYPKLVEALLVRNGIAHGQKINSMDQTVILANTDALIRELGENDV